MSDFLKFTLIMWFSGPKNLQCYPNLDKMVYQEISINDKSLSAEQGTLIETSQRVNVFHMQCAGDLSWLGTLKWQTAES